MLWVLMHPGTPKHRSARWSWPRAWHLSRGPLSSLTGTPCSLGPVMRGFLPRGRKGTARLGDSGKFKDGFSNTYYTGLVIVSGFLRLSCMSNEMGATVHWVGGPCFACSQPRLDAYHPAVVPQLQPGVSPGHSLSKKRSETGGKCA